MSEHVDIELLLVPHCRHAPAAQDLLRSALAAAGLPATRIRVSVIGSQHEAAERGFVGSPTILINGIDPFAEPGRPAALACRIYAGPNRPGGLPSANELQRALTAARAVPSTMGEPDR